MLYITLVCNLGMSTSMLVDKMSKAAEQKGVEVDIAAMPFDKMGTRIKETQILLLGPQVRHLLKKFQNEYGSNIPVIDVMNMSDYALLKGDNILDSCIKSFKEKTNS